MYRLFTFKAGLLSLLVPLTAFSVMAQDRTISGTVIGDDGEALINATVMIKETKGGTVTDFDGKYQIKVPAEGKTLVFSYVGFGSQEVEIGEQTTIDVTLMPDEQLDDIIVTALGVERAEEKLGYSVQKLSSEQLSTVKPANINNALAGKVSGVYVTGSAAGPTASANVNIRGASSLLGNNQPLYVVNGIPITNDLFSFDDGLNGSSTIDFGNASQIVNPDDIASMNILKGPAASALYGSRAANGVILITTKTGEKSSGLGVSINNSTTFETILKLPDYQNEFGFGGGGKYSYFDGSNYIGDQEYYEAYGENWGPRMNGQLIKQFNSDGEPVPFTPAEDNIRNFFRTGITTINNIALTNSSEGGDFRLSYTNTARRGIVPNSNLRRNTFAGSIGKKLLNDKLKVRLNAMFIGSGSDNVPNSGYDESSSIMYGWLWYPRQVAIDDLRDYWQPGQEGVQQRYVENLWVNNPWFIANENTNAFRSDRLISNLVLNYQLNDRFSVRFRYGADVLNEERQYRRAPSTKGALQGSYREDEITFTETNAEFLVGYESERGRDFMVDVRLGGNIMQQDANYLVANNPQLKLFGPSESIYTLSNAAGQVLVESQKTQTGINSLFSTATFSFRDLIYVDATYRHDWNSTLVNPEVGIDNSEFDFGYPSVSVSAIISEMLDLSGSSPISFLKLKSAYAEVGNGAPPYSFGNTYQPQAGFGNATAFTTNNTITDPSLTNERTRAFEIGTDLRMFTNRFRLDFTYYAMNSLDQVIFLPVASTSGYNSFLTNGGEISNKGIELMISGTLIQKTNFSWTATLNMGHNRAVVESLPDVIESGRYSIVADVFPGDEGGADLEYVAEEGQLLGQLYGLGFQRGPDGRVIHYGDGHPQEGLPVLTDEKVSAGSYQPDARIGLLNSFKFGNFSLGILFDGQIGGKIYSRSHALYATGGTITNNDDPNLDLSTLDGRTVYSVSYDANGDPVYTLEQEGGVVGPGWKWDDVNGNGEVDGDELAENDIEVPAGGAGYTGYFYAYYGNGFNRDNIEAATYDATYFKLRELSISYNLPKAFVSKLGMARATVSIIGRNLLLFTNVPTIDPETYSIRNGIFVNGFESTQMPSTRSLGFSINVGF